MANVYYENHGNPSLIKSKRVAVIGYGSQGHAHCSEHARQRCQRQGRNLCGEPFRRLVRKKMAFR